MYISELNLHGFKSFAKKEKIKFGEGVTVIVGPNGCGKTNIVDAIRWVLGEQKYSVLRSGKMGDVIFNGADGLKPLSVCEAYLTVHNIVESCLLNIPILKSEEEFIGMVNQNTL